MGHGGDRFGGAEFGTYLRNLAPKALWLRSRAQAASRSAVDARLTTCRVPRLSTLPPLLRLSGHKPSQEAKCFFCLPATHVYAHFGDDGLCILHINAIDSRKVHDRDAV